MNRRELEREVKNIKNNSMINKNTNKTGLVKPDICDKIIIEQDIEQKILDDLNNYLDLHHVCK